ncbi:MAG: hypothetical protein ONB46_17130 [candidate division KSB1 bacterium]|nr:hypothetical protein [candidate division KSB1 bacterium]MDZ7367442.1 hypothetical protein [candidate division KSB1 bacterium]
MQKLFHHKDTKNAKVFWGELDAFMVKFDYGSPGLPLQIPA